LEAACFHRPPDENSRRRLRRSRERVRSARRARAKFRVFNRKSRGPPMNRRPVRTALVVQYICVASPDHFNSDAEQFDSEAYVRRMVAERTVRERETRRRERQPFMSLAVRAVGSLLWTPLVIFCTYALRWTELIPSVNATGRAHAGEWPWLVGSLVLTAYSAFYGIAAGLGTRGGEESRRVAVGSFYGFWFWLPMLLMYPGTKRLGVSSDNHALSAFVLIGLGQTIFVWSMARWSERYVGEQSHRA
jgi:hypothetical protein